MSDGQETAAKLAIGRSSNYRLIYTTAFKSRVGSGDCAIQFAVQTDMPGSDGANLLQEEVCVVMTWPVLKRLSEQLSMTVEAIEKEVAPIPSTPVVMPAEQFKEALVSNVRALKLGKPESAG